MKSMRESLSMATQVGCVALAALVLTLDSGCRSTRKSSAGLLGPRAIVPPPYTEPAAPVAAGTTPALPAEQSTEEVLPPVTPAVLPPGTNQVQPPENAVTPPSPPAQETPTIVLPPTVKSKTLSYTVKRGDSLWSIARMYGVSYQELAGENQLDPKAVLRVGKVLRIPPGGRFVPPSERTKVHHARSHKSRAHTRRSGRTHTAVSRRSHARSPLPSGGVYTVKSGDSLWTIAHRFGLKSSDIRRINNLKSDVLQVGQKLRLTKSGATPVGPPSPAAPGPAMPKAPAGLIGPNGPNPQGAAPTGAATGGTGNANVENTGAGNVSANTLTPATTPGSAEPGLVLPKRLSHTVVAGDTLESIAQMYGTSVQDILKANPSIKSDADLKVDTKIMVPYH